MHSLSHEAENKLERLIRTHDLCGVYGNFHYNSQVNALEVLLRHFKDNHEKAVEYALQFNDHCKLEAFTLLLPYFKGNLEEAITNSIRIESHRSLGGLKILLETGIDFDKAMQYVLTYAFNQRALEILLKQFDNPEDAVKAAQPFDGVFVRGDAQVSALEFFLENLNDKEKSINFALRFDDIWQVSALRSLFFYFNQDLEKIVINALKFSDLSQCYALDILLLHMEEQPEQAVTYALKLKTGADLALLRDLLAIYPNPEDAVDTALKFTDFAQSYVFSFLHKKNPHNVEKNLEVALSIKRMEQNAAFQDLYDRLDDLEVTKAIALKFKNSTQTDALNILLPHFEDNPEEAAEFALRFKKFPNLMFTRWNHYGQVSVLKILLEKKMDAKEAVLSSLRFDDNEQAVALERLLNHGIDPIKAVSHALKFKMHSTDYNVMDVSDHVKALEYLLPKFTNTDKAIEFALKFNGCSNFNGGYRYCDYQLSPSQQLSDLSNYLKHTNFNYQRTSIEDLELFSSRFDNPSLAIRVARSGNLTKIAIKYCFLIQDEWNFLLWGGDHDNRGDEVIYELPNNNSDDNDDDESGNAGIKMPASTTNNNRDNTSTHTDNGDATQGGNDQNTSRSNGNSSSENSDNNYNTELTSIFIAKNTHITDASLIDYEPPTLATVIDKHMDTGLAGMLDAIEYSK